MSTMFRHTFGSPLLLRILRPRTSCLKARIPAQTRLFVNTPPPPDRNKSILIWCLSIASAMVGLSYAAVPLYRLFCQATGMGGYVTKSNEESFGIAQQKLKNQSITPRIFTVHFDANVNSNLPWRFEPCQPHVRVVTGEPALATYRVKNLSDKPLIGISTYNVTPDRAALYFNKIQCFCFDEQLLKPHEELEMPVLFLIDPDIVNDQTLRNLTAITLSYTFFRAYDDEEAEQTAVAAASHSGPAVHVAHKQ